MSHYDLYAIGNALVDTEYEVSDAQLGAMGVEKRHMTLIDTERRAALLGQLHGLHARRTGGELILHPTEEHVMKLATRWSLDPTLLDTATYPASIGHIACSPAHWRAERMRKTA